MKKMMFVQKFFRNLNTFQKNCRGELHQSKATTHACLFNILSSKRLLADHVDILEEIFNNFELTFTDTNYFSPVSFSLLSTTLFVFYAQTENGFRGVVPPIAAGIATLFFFKLIKKCMSTVVENRCQRIVNAIETFESHLKRKLTYLNEIQLIQSSKKSSAQSISTDDEMQTDCAKSIINFTTILYSGANSLETNLPLPDKIKQCYEPLEDLANCDLFQVAHTKTSIRHIKDLYNVFSYIQSYFLMRLGLALAYCQNFRKIGHITNSMHGLMDAQLQAKAEVDRIIAARLDAHSKLGTSPVRGGARAKAIDHLPGSNLRNCSLSLTSRITAVATECIHLDQVLQDIATNDDLQIEQASESINETMAEIEERLLNCQTDFKRLILTYQKFLMCKFAIPVPDEAASNGESSCDDQEMDNERDIKKTIVDAHRPQTVEDDFFILDGTERLSEQNETPNYDDELTQLNRKIIKTTFKPVLKQLKQKITPINERMQAREKKVLEAKGLRFDSFGATLDPIGNASGSSDDENNCETIRRRRPLIRRNKYDEERQNLMSKQQLIGFLPPPRANAMEEDVLE